MEDAGTVSGDGLRFLMFIAVTVGSGVIGGLSRTVLNGGRDNRLGVVADLFPSAMAALLVPLFLDLGKSSLVHNLLDLPDFPYVDLSVYIGFCLLAGASARRFINRLSEQVLAEVAETKRISAEAKETALEAKDLSAEAAVATDPAAVATGMGGGPSGADRLSALRDLPGLETDHRRLVDAMANGRLRRRSVSGLANELGLPRERARTLLNDLLGKGVVEKVHSPSQGTDLYRLPPAGDAD